MATQVSVPMLQPTVQTSLVPPGAVMSFAMSAAPVGWYPCDGTTVSRTGSGANLFAAIGTIHGVGNNSTTFNVPNLQGQFIRGLTTNLSTTSRDPLSATRVNQIGNVQTDVFKSHNHNGTTIAGGSHEHDVNIVIGSTGAGSALQASNAASNEHPTGRVDVQPGGVHSHTFTSNNTGDIETRPINIALLFCIKL